MYVFRAKYRNQGKSFHFSHFRVFWRLLNISYVNVQTTKQNVSIYSDFFNYEIIVIISLCWLVGFFFIKIFIAQIYNELIDKPYD